jgi:hypothetical protein
VHVELGPLPSDSVLAWLDYAGTVLMHDGAAPPLADDVPADATRSFLGYITEWHKAALRDPEFHWESDMPGEVAEYLVLAFYRIVQRLAEAAELRGAPLAPPEGHAFYVTLVHGLLDSLANEGPGAKEFSDHLRSFWPGLDS